MIQPQDLVTLQQGLGAAKRSFILIGKTPKYDDVASALSLYLGLKALNHDVVIASPIKLTVAYSHLVGVNQIKKEISNKNLVMSFPYQDGFVDKVSYTMSEDGSTFNLIVAPKSGMTALDPSRVSYSYAGAEADVMFLFGASSMEDFEYFYQEESALFMKTLTVQFSLTKQTPFAKMMIDVTGKSSLSEEMIALFPLFGITLSEDIATNILSSIELVTNHLQSLSISPETFEVVAKLLRAGARRSSVATTPIMSSSQTNAFAQALKTKVSVPSAGSAGPTVQPTQPLPVRKVGPPSVTPEQKAKLRLDAEKKKVEELTQQLHEEQTKATQQKAQTPEDMKIQQLQHIASVPTQETKQRPTAQPTEQTPSDWLQPKIFTGATQVE